MPKVKICGLSRPCDIDYVNEANVDYAGFVFAKSSRQITKETAKELKDRLNSNIKSVGVFVNENINYIHYLVKNKIIDIVQLHGDEDYDYIEKLKNVIHVPIIKAVVVNNENDIISAGMLEVDYLLLDSGGGSGNCFDWAVNTITKKPLFIAGGININNLKGAVDTFSPFAIDISSGVETDGVKDRDKILKFVQKIRSDNNE